MSKKKRTKQQKQQAASARTDSSENPANDKKNSSGAREFLYLDTGRIHSYLSQLEGGLRLLAEKVEESYSSTQETDPQKIERQQASAKATLAGMIPVLLSAGTGKFNYGYERQLTDEQRVAKTEDRAVRTDLSILHHKAFDLVQEAIGEHLLNITGRATFVDVNYLGRLVRSHNDRLARQLSSESSEYKEHEQTRQDSEYGFELMGLLGTELLIYVEDPEGMSVNAIGDLSHLTLPTSTIQYAYGSPSSRNITMVGIEGRGPGSSDQRHPTQIKPEHDAFEALRALNNLEDRIHDFFGTNNGTRVYPLAIYIDL